MNWWPWRRPAEEPEPGWTAVTLECLVRPAPHVGWEWVCQEARTDHPPLSVVRRNTEGGVGLTFPTTTRTVLDWGWRPTERGARLAARRAQTRDGRGKWQRA